MATSPTQRTLKHYRDKGWTCQVVEKWNPFAKIRQDLFGFIDVVAMSEGKIAGIQSTSASNHSKRKHKILEAEKALEWIQAGGIIIISSWYKNSKNRWVHREEFVNQEEF